MEYDHIVIGGGIFGCYLAIKLVELDPGADVILLEREGDLLQRASYNNQARIHNGYHYPRSLVTGLRSRINFPRFTAEFAECVVDDFDKLYAIASRRSNVTSSQFVQFCSRIGSEIRPAPAHYRRLFNSDLIADVFRVKEFAFDAVRLKDLMWRRLDHAGISVMTQAEVQTVVPGAEFVASGRTRLEVSDLRTGETIWIASNHVYNCTYSGLNAVLHRSGLNRLNLRHEKTELALIRVPGDLANLGITVMCGPFFSVMPFPARGLHSLSHVSFTPHYRWSELPSDQSVTQHSSPLPLASQHDRMVRDAARYVPSMIESQYVDSLWEVKTILPQSDVDDGRPVLFKRDAKATGLVSVLGGKIDNIYELDDALKKCLAESEPNAKVAQPGPGHSGIAAMMLTAGPAIPGEDHRSDLAFHSISPDSPEDLVP